MHDVIIRPAILADAEVILDIENQCFITDKISRRQIKYLLSKARAINFVAEQNGQVVAYCICLLRPHPSPARLYSIAVAPAWQGRGLAKQLITTLFSHLVNIGCQRCRLEVRESQLHAQTLYRQLGFIGIKNLPYYYADGAAGLSMEASLLDQSEPGRPDH